LAETEERIMGFLPGVATDAFTLPGAGAFTGVVDDDAAPGRFEVVWGATPTAGGGTFCTDDEVAFLAAGLPTASGDFAATEERIMGFLPAVATDAFTLPGAGAFTGVVEDDSAPGRFEVVLGATATAGKGAFCTDVEVAFPAATLPTASVDFAEIVERIMGFWPAVPAGVFTLPGAGAFTGAVEDDAAPGRFEVVLGATVTAGKGTFCTDVEVAFPATGLPRASLDFAGTEERIMGFLLGVVADVFTLPGAGAPTGIDEDDPASGRFEVVLGATVTAGKGTLCTDVEVAFPATGLPTASGDFAGTEERIMGFLLGVVADVFTLTGAGVPTGIVEGDPASGRFEAVLGATATAGKCTDVEVAFPFTGLPTASLDFAGTEERIMGFLLGVATDAFTLPGTDAFTRVVLDDPAPRRFEVV
jgi:hypothetical protein